MGETGFDKKNQLNLMANLILTHQCNQHCPFCFTGFAAQKAARQMVSLQQYKEMLAFLRVNNLPQIRLLGGEPTLHPQFADILHLALQEGKQIVLFSNGLIPENALKEITNAAASESLIVLININVYFQNLPNSKVTDRIKQVLAKLGGNCQLGYTIHTHQLPAMEIFEHIQKYGLIKSLRLGLAQPIGHNNQFLLPCSYPFIGEKIIDAAQKALHNNIKIELDCGFVRCMFPEQSQPLFPDGDASSAFHCNPIIDLDVDGSALACFPLSQELRLPDALANPREEIIGFFNSKLQNLRGLGIYPECSQCTFLATQECNGGCLAMVLNRFQKENRSE